MSYVSQLVRTVHHFAGLILNKIIVILHVKV